MLEWSLLRIGAVLLLMLATAFFVAAEFALVSVRETRLEALSGEGRPGARTALRLKRELDDLLPATQLGVTLCSLLLGWVGESAVAQLLLGVLHHLPFPHDLANQAGAGRLTAWAHGAAVVLAFALITYLDVLLGEQVPKALSLQRTERIVLAVAAPMDLLIRVLRPAVRLLKRSTALVLRVFRVELRPETAGAHSPEEIKLASTATRRSGLLPEFQERIIHRAIDLNHVTTREIMTPRGRIFSLPADMPLGVASGRVVEEQHSRVPVYDPVLGPEHIVGVVYSKDIARLMHFNGARPGAAPLDGTATLPLRSVLRDILVVPETKLAVDLLQEFQERRRQIAMVVDEFGSTVGLVTAEDALEQVVGELEDEFDVVQTPHREPLRPAESIELDGAVKLRDLTVQMGWTFPREPGVETLAGFLLAQLGHLPTPGERVVFDGREFTVLEMELRRISRVQVLQLERLPEGEAEEEEPA